MSEPTQTVEASNPVLGHLKVSGANVTTMFTIGTFVLSAIIAWVLTSHTADAKDGSKEIARELKDSNREVSQALKDSNKELAVILKELVQSTREQNCLLSLPQERRAAGAYDCRRNAR